MKEYDTGEAINKIIHNSSLKFVLIRDKRTMISSMSGHFQISGTVITKLEEIFPDDKWVPLETEVDFMTAANSGKNIRVVYRDDDGNLDPWYKEYHPLDCVLSRLGDNYSSVAIGLILKNGTWYVQEVND